MGRKDLLVTTDQITQNADIRHTFSRLATRGPPDIKIVSHSNIVYWWPAWLVGYTVAVVSYAQGQSVAITPDIIDRIHQSNNPGILFIAVLGLDRLPLKLKLLAEIEEAVALCEGSISLAPAGSGKGV